VPYVLRGLPYFDSHTQVKFPSEPRPIPVLASQIIVWCGLTRSTDFEPDPERHFPVIFDTGLSHNFSIKAEQLTAWSGLRVEDLPIVGDSQIRVPGSRPDEPPSLVPRHKIRLWIYGNLPGDRDPVLTEAPFDLKVDNGVPVYPPGMPAPRLPLLGLRGLQWSKLRLLINSERRYLSLRTPFGAASTMGI
jgi:hypothetical protein